MPNGVYPVPKFRFHDNRRTASEPASPWLKLRVLTHRETLDHQLAQGVDPVTSKALALRAEQLVRGRAQLATRVDGVLEAAAKPTFPFTAACRVRRAEVRDCADDLLALARRLSDARRSTCRAWPWPRSCSATVPARSTRATDRCGTPSAPRAWRSTPSAPWSRSCWSPPELRPAPVAVRASAARARAAPRPTAAAARRRPARPAGRRSAGRRRGRRGDRDRRLAGHVPDAGEGIDPRHAQQRARGAQAPPTAPRPPAAGSRSGSAAGRGRGTARRGGRRGGPRRAAPCSIRPPGNSRPMRAKPRVRRCSRSGRGHRSASWAIPPR